MEDVTSVSLNRGEDNHAHIKIGDVSAKLTPAELTHLINLLIALRSSLSPSLLEDPSSLGNCVTHPTDMKWRAATIEGKPGVQLDVGHPGLGWLSLHLDPNQVQGFLAGLHGIDWGGEVDLH